MFEGWEKFAARLCNLANDNTLELNDGQRASLKAIAERLPDNGIIIADEVGMGKTRIATTVTKAVIEAGGRVAILVPPGLGFQWGDELRKSKVEGVPDILRSLDAYLHAWSDTTKDKKNTKKKAQMPWANYKAVIISNVFCNWQVKSNTRDNSKWSLLPQTMALMQAQLRESRRMPRGAGSQQKNYKQEIISAATWITRNANFEILESLARQEGFDQWGDSSPFFNSANYRKTGGNTKFREALERVVGLGLGEFDLVVIDEAHKMRGSESNLERLLKHVICFRRNSRRLAMTATPIELDVSQWEQILERIGTKDDQANTAITNYAAAVEHVRKLPSDEPARKVFADKAKQFQSSLGKYLLRRDKREVQAVKDFAAHNSSAHSDYRRLNEITVSPKHDLLPAWKQAVCAAEALSFTTKGMSDQTAKRLRLTLGNGYGISTLIDEVLRDTKEDPDDHDAKKNPELNGELDKKTERVNWWKKSIANAFCADMETMQVADTTLYEHPAILAAVKAIEAVCACKQDKQGEKVLVFGRFTRPMQALVRLLNAREMLRRLDEDNPRWPQAAVHENEKAAVLAAILQLKKNDSLEKINQRLDNQYKKLENERERFRTRLREVLSQRLTALGDKKMEHALTLFARPIQEMLATVDPTNDEIFKDKILNAFKAVVAAASDQDKETVTTDDEAEGNAVNQLSKELLQRLEDEYGRTEGGFARLMSGTAAKEPHTRRLLQLAFNREHSHPKVLVAQSVVGREGLNLHEACRTVILLHAEWNPGVVEQQIGRVDRINSLWEKKLKEALATPADELPRIEIRPVIFQGTYDEHNWKVLMQRWDDLRAQLHGVVITPSTGEKLPLELVKTINACAPNFSPTQSSC